MAADGLIDRYLAAFAAHVRQRRDADDLVDEVTDHLLTAVERLESAGVERTTAEQRALARLGEPRLVASLLLAEPSEGSIMSLFFSRHLGVIATLAVVFWVVSASLSYWGITDAGGAWSQTTYLVTAAAITVACLLTTAALVGVDLRAVGAVDAAALGIAALGAAATVASLIAWAVGIWVPLLAAAVTWTLVRALTARGASRPFLVVLIVLMPILAVTAAATTAVGVLTATDTGHIGWIVVLGLAAVVIALLVDVVARLSRHVRRRGHEVVV